jgi:DNA repair protein RadA/Sms
MSKVKKYFECQNCGAQFSKWQGQCTECNRWNTLEEVSFSENPVKADFLKDDVTVHSVDTIQFNPKDRIKTNISEFDRVLGDGFLPGQSILLAGEPGIGKSTLLLQIGNNLELPVYYICGEESYYQVKQRYSRLELKKKNLLLLENSSVESIVDYLSKQSIGLIIVDSVHSLFSSKFKSSAGSISQVKESSQNMVSLAKRLGFPLILVGQINKEGEIAGPKTLEHLVDTVCVLEGDNNHIFRILRSTKNRFGSVNEVGLFLMEEKGLVSVAKPSEIFLNGRLENASGSSISIINEGTRCFAVEVQALTQKTVYGYPKRTSSGFSLNRLNLLAAVISKRTSIDLSEYDIYLNIASGVKVNEPAIDLAVCSAIISSFKNKPLNRNAAFYGEVGLNGEVRPVKMDSLRKKEAKNMGIKYLFEPEAYHSLKDVVNQLFKS